MISQPLNVPQSSGVYVFRKGKLFLYIGKAANLKKRLSFYWRKNSDRKTRLLLKEATGIGWFGSVSETDALIKEAELIKKYQPKFNVDWKSDVNYFFVSITKEKFPRISITHQPQQVKNIRYIGPFTSGASLKLVLKLLRRIFPHCTCKKPHKRPCLNAQIGRCFGFCCLLNVRHESVNEYLENIKNIVAILSGRKKKLIFQLKKEMMAAAKNQEFEKAAKLRNQILGLENIFQHAPYNRDESPPKGWDKIQKDLKAILETKRRIFRVEGYDISNISGKEATGSMAVFAGGLPIKSEYRKFRIKTVKQISDVDMLKEIISRRLKHKEWPYPDLMLIDGGRGQLNAVVTILRKFDFPREVIFSKIIALAKREEELYIENRKLPIKLSSLPQSTSFFLQRIRDEAHRFARRYHHKLREISYRG